MQLDVFGLNLDQPVVIVSELLSIVLGSISKCMVFGIAVAQNVSARDDFVYELLVLLLQDLLLLLLLLYLSLNLLPCKLKHKIH